MRDDQRNYVMVGIFVIAMIAGLILWIALLSGRTGATDTYYVRYDDVLGLAEGTQIYFDGYPVGLIESIEPMDDGDDQLFRLEVSIRKGWKIPDDSVAEITASGLLSAVVINIDSGDSPTALSPGDQIPSVEAANLLAVMTEAASGFSEFLLDTLQPQIEGIVADLNQTMGQVNALLSPANTGRIGRILVNLENVSEEVDGMSSGLTQTQAELDRVLR
jgi:phospholipid/cholesterol/gamma-HCH transport system substrate-binding protein